MAVRLDRKRLTVVVLDPWELRYAGEHELGDRAETLCRVLQETVHRERPQLLTVLKSDKALLRAASRISRTLKLPLLAFTPAQVKRLAVADARRDDQPFTGTARLTPTMALARAALGQLLKKYYDDQRQNNRRQKP